MGEDLHAAGRTEDAVREIHGLEEDAGYRREGESLGRPGPHRDPFRYQEEIGVGCALALTRIALDQEEWNEAERQLTQLDARASNPTGDLAAAALLARLRIAQGREDEAGLALHLAEALSRTAQQLAGLEASPEAYLVYDQGRELRTLIHDILEDEPRLGYEFELAWRTLPTLIGSEARPTPLIQGETAIDVLRAWIDRHAGSPDIGASHVLFVLHGEQVLRFHRRGTTVRRATLGIHVDALRPQIADAVRRISADPGDLEEADPEMEGVLRRLYRELLGDLPLGAERVLITPDRLLHEVPFAALNLADVGYRPWIEEADVAGLRFFRAERSPAPQGAPIVLAPGVLSGESKAPSGGPVLVHADREAVHAASILRGARLLRGRQATKETIVSLWSNAPVVYFAGHVVRDPEVPFLAYLPLLPSAPHDVASDRIDLAEIRASDFSGCSLVVLSGCASGAPYVDRDSAAPGLGSAFLDAGAEAAVHTRWRVRDDVAATLMQSFLSAWRNNGGDPVLALRECQRSLLASSDGRRHPFAWAAFDVELAPTR